MKKKNDELICSICGTDVDLEGRGGTSGYFGIIPVTFCEWCLSSLHSMFEVLWCEYCEHRCDKDDCKDRTVEEDDHDH